MSSEVWVNSPDYSQRLAIIADTPGADGSYTFSHLVYRRVENEMTELVLTMPYVDGLVELFPLDARLEIYEDGALQGETQWFVRVPPKLLYDEVGALIVEVHAECALYLLAGRIVAYAAGSLEAEKTGPADDVIKEIVRENLGSLAITDRDLSAYLDVQVDSSQGATVYKTMPRRNVLLVCQELARASAQAGKPIFFDVVWTGSRLEFRTYLDKRGDDHRMSSASPVVLSPEFDTLANASRSFDHREEITVVYCAGQNTGADRVIVSVSDDDRRTASPFNRRELFVDARYLALTESLATEADGTLWRRRPVQQLDGQVRDTDQVRYGQEWTWGDLLAAEFNGEILDVRVHGVEVTISGGRRLIAAELRADSTEADDPPTRRIEGQLDAGAPNELPIFSETPVDHAVPRAPDGSTTIADGWLSSAIARVASLTAHSGLTTGVHGVGSSYVAKTSRSDQWPDWADIQSKPASFAPSGHAASHTTSGSDPLVPEDIGAAAELHAVQHKHGGGDEVGTATAAAHAIPKAGAGGTIADGWLSAAISRITSIAFSLPSIFSVSGSPLTSNGTITATLANQSANAVFSGPASGAAAAPTFRALVAADVPSLDASKIATGQLAPARGGTGVDNGTNALTIPATGTAALRASAATAGRVGFWSDANSVSHDANLTWDRTNQWVVFGPKDNGGGFYVPFKIADSGGSARTVFGLSSSSPPDVLLNMPAGQSLRVLFNAATEVVRFTNTGLLVGKTLGLTGVGDLDTVGHIQTTGGNVRIQTTTPGFWLDETDGGVKGAFFVLDAGRLQIQRRATGFGAFEAGVVDIAITAPGSSLSISSNGTLGIGKSPGLTGAGDLDAAGNLRTDKALLIKDGLSAPSATSGYATIYVDSADGDLKVKFGDGIVKTIVVDT